MIQDPSGRGPGGRQLFAAGVALLVVIGATTTVLLMRYGGVFSSNVAVVAELTSSGDGVPAGSDVKFRGLTIGRVHSSRAAAAGEIQRVDIDLRPEYAPGVPADVTARVVPSNVFAVTSIELIDNGPGAPITAGAVIHQDRSRKTVALQSALTTFRTVLTTLEPDRLERVLATLAAALNPSARMPGSTLERLDRWLTAVDRAGISSDIGNFTAAAAGLDRSAPELLGVLSNAVTTARTVSERRDKLTALLTSAGDTVDTVNGLIARNPGVGPELTAGLGDTFAAMTADPGALPAAVTNLGAALRKYATTFHPGPNGRTRWEWSVDVSLTPFRPYTRADCPRYGALAGPSCATAPTAADPGTLPTQWRAAPRPTPPPVPFLPGLTPPMPVHPAALRGPAAVTALVGHAPNATELLLLGAALTGGSVHPVSGTGA